MTSRQIPFLIVAALACSSIASAQVIPQSDSLQSSQDRLSLEDRVAITQSGWQPLFKSAASGGGDLVFEVPVTIANPPRAVRIRSDGLEKLTTPDQVIVTCQIGAEIEFDFEVAGYTSFPRTVTTSLPLASLSAGATRTVRLALDVPDEVKDTISGAAWRCGMAIWSSSESAACDEGSCALPRNSTMITYEPAADSSTRLIATGTLPNLR